MAVEQTDLDSDLARVGEARARADQELAGLDALEQPLVPREPVARRVWSATWPKLGAVFIVFAIWQLVVWWGWRPESVLPSPLTVLDQLQQDVRTTQFWNSIWITMWRGIYGFGISVVIGVVLGALIVQFKPMRAAFGSLITGFQTMPSVAWMPLAVLLFQLSEQAILFVVVLGAVPSIANGLINGVDHIPPILRRAGKVLGATGFAEFRHVVLPAAMPAFVAGLKQGWAFAWRSLMAGELIVVIAGKPSIGFLLQQNRDLLDSVGLMEWILVILVLGILVDALVFAVLDTTVRRRRGLLVA